MKKSGYEAITRIDFDSSTFTGSYQLAGSLGNDVQIFKVVNNSTVDADISYDGATDNDFAPLKGGFVLDVTSNGTTDKAAMAKGTNIWLNGSAGTGNIYIIGYRQRS